MAAPVVFDPACKAAYKQMCDQKKPNDWMCCVLRSGAGGGEDGGEELKLELVGEGRGGMHAFAKCVDSQCLGALGVGLFRVTAVDARGSTTAFRTKLILAMYAGSVPAMNRTRLKACAPSLVKHFPHSNLMDTLDLDDFSEAHVEKLLRSAGGAHQPTHFDFTNEEVDNKQ